MFWMSEYSHAGNVSVYMVEDHTPESSLTIEVFVDVATEYLGSYDLAISFNQELLQFQSLSSGNTYGQLLPEPIHSVKDGLLKVNGIFKHLPKGLVSLLFIHFEGTSNCVHLPFDLYVYGLIGKDTDLPIDVIGFEITQNAIERMQKKQLDQLPLVDLDTVEQIKPLVGTLFNQKDLFIDQLIETIGEAKTNQYQADILMLSRIAHHLNIEMNCSCVIDIIECLQFLSGIDNATCSNLAGENNVGLDDVMAHFQKISFFPIKM